MKRKPPPHTVKDNVPIADLNEILARLRRVREIIERLTPDELQELDDWAKKVIATLESDDCFLSDLDEIGDNPIMKHLQ